MPQARQWFKSSGRRPAAKRQAGDSGAGGRREVRRGNIGTGKTGGSGQRQRRQHQARRSAQVTAQASGPRIAVDGITAGVGRNRVDTANAAQLAGLDILGQHGHRRPQRRQHGQESQPGGKAFPYRECQSELGVVEHGGIIGCRVLRRRARSSSSSSSFLFLVLLAGSRPGGRGTFGETRKAGFLCSPKARYARGVCSLRAAKLRKHQKYPKERRPAVWVPSLRCGQPALLDCGGGNRDQEPNTKDKEDKYKQGHAMACPCGLRYWYFCPHPLCMRRGAQVQADKGSRCLSEASLARPRLNRAPQVARSEAQGRRHQGRLFFCLLFFWRSKRKVSSCRATPGQQNQEEERGG